MTAIGIDFGTTNSVMSAYSAAGPVTLEIDTPDGSWADLGFAHVLPTVFAVEGQTPTFGWRAKTGEGEKVEALKRMLRNEETVSIAGHSFLVEELAAMFFSHLKSKAAESGFEARNAVVTVPANSRGVARHRTRLAAAMSGINVLALINEPTAAAMAYSASMPFDQRIMVVDWGGGTLDVTILQAQDGVFIEQASKGIQQLGGLEFDARLARLVAERTAGSANWTAAQRRVFRLEIERAKVLLSRRAQVSMQLPDGRPFHLDREQLNSAIGPLVERVTEPITQTLRDIGATPDQIDSVILVGGTCNVPLVRTVVEAAMGQEPAAGVDPMTAVSQGAAIAAAILLGEEQDNDFFVATEHALGTIIVNPDNQELEFDTIIARNHKLPAEATESYVPVSPTSSKITIRVVEGDPGMPIDHEDMVTLMSIDVPLDSSRPNPTDRAIDLTYHYDVDGILHITVTDLLTGDVIVGPRPAWEGPSDGDKRRLVEVSQRAQRTVSEQRVQQPKQAPPASLDAESQELLQRARIKVIPFLDDDEAARLRALANDLESTDPANRPHVRQQLSDALLPYSYLF